MAKATTGILMGGLSGKAGTVVFVRGALGDTYVRTRVRPRNPRTPAQMQLRAFMTEAGQVWRGMTVAEVAKWKDYAKVAGGDNRNNAITLFTGLAVKFRQAGGTGPIPVAPPSQRFTGDGIRVTADTPAPGRLRFTASGANTADVLTELLVQPLPSPHRSPTQRLFRPLSFVGFTPGSLSFEATLPAGFYGCAVRFVKASTGQMSDFVPLGVVTVS